MGLPFTHPSFPSDLAHWITYLQLPFQPHTLQPHLLSFMTPCQSEGQGYKFEKALIIAKADLSVPQRLPANISASLNSF